MELGIKGSVMAKPKDDPTISVNLFRDPD